MAIATVAEFVTLLRRLRLLEPQQFDALDALQAQFREPLALAREFIQRDWLTPYQVNLLFNDRGGELLLGSYVVLERLGEGGMGFVYKARNWKLGRVVAVKVIRREKFEQVESLERFRREVQLAARLSHPHVVAALDAGESEGAVYYAMAYIEGLDLCKLVQQRGPLPIALACECIRQAALGLQHAYELGLVHRDIKPNNLMIEGAFGKKDDPLPASFTVKILDFGLARPDPMGGADGEPRLTQIGKVVGTPDFLAPEQARDSGRVDIRADLYSLGCTFYFLLTGLPPFPEGTTIEKLMQHQLEEPVPVAERRPDTPAPLAALLRKLMAKRPEARYQTPAEVVLALQDFLLGRPVGGAIRPALPPLAGPVALATSLAEQPPRAEVARVRNENDTTVESAAITPPVSRRVPPRRRSAARALLAAPARTRWLLVGGLLALLALLVWQLRSGPRTPSTSTPNPPGSRRSLLDKFDPARIPAEQRLRDLPVEVVAVLGDQRLQHSAWVRQAALSPDGRLIVSAGLDQVLCVWDAATGRQQSVLPFSGQWVHTLAFTTGKPRVRYALGVPGATVFEWDLAASSTGRPRTLLASEDCGTFLALSSDGRFLAHRKVGKAGMGPIQIRNLDDGTSRELAHNPEGAQRVALAADGKRLAVAEGRAVRWWDLAQQPAVEGAALTLDAEATSLGLALSADGTMLAVAALQRNDRFAAVEVKLWHLQGGAKREKNQLRGSFRVKGPQVAGVAFSADGKTLAVAHNFGQAGHVALWDIAGERERAALTSEGAVAALGFARDRPLLVTGAEHGLRLWDASTAKELLAWGRPRAPVSALLPLPDGQRVVVVRGLFEQSVSLWDLEQDREIPITSGLRPSVQARLTGGPAPRWLAVGQRDRLGFWSLDADPVEHAHLPLEQNTSLQAWTVTPDGTLLFTTHKSDKEVRVWNVPRQPQAEFSRAARTLAGHKVVPTTLVVAPNSQLLASAGSDGEVKVWDVAAGTERYSLTHATAGASVALAFSPDSQMLATVTRENGIRLWAAHTGRLERSFKAGAGESALVTQVQFSPDGKQLLLPSNRGLRVWDLGAGQERLEYSARSLMRATVFGPDGRLLAAAADDCSLRVWEIDGAKPRELRFPGPIHALSFAPDGRHLFTGNGNGSVYLLRLEAAE